MTDKAMLTALLTCGRLTEEEEAAFRSMLERLENNKKTTTLSAKQRQWVQTVHTRLDLTAESHLQRQVRPVGG
jgi:ribosome assembly protein YihI (activator of Der GTPase)